MDPMEKDIADRQAQLTAWLSEEAAGFPGCRIEHYTEGGKYGYAWKVYLNDVQMGEITPTVEVNQPEDKVRGFLRVRLREILGQPA
jgi:hypothetical protein